jgi:phosphoglycolate phosphatase
LMAPENVTAVLFDFDMTLVDSSYGIHHCMNELAKHFGLREVTHAEVLHTIGFQIEDAWKYLWGSYREEWIEYYRKNFREEENKRMRLFPNTINVLESLRARGIKVGIASNRRYAKRPLEYLGITKYMDVIIGLENAENPKPAPDVLVKALEALAMGPANALYVGDTDLDMQTAVAADVRGVGMTTGNFDAKGLTDAGAWRVLDDLGEIVQLVAE